MRSASRCLTAVAAALLTVTVPAIPVAVADLAAPPHRFLYVAGLASNDVSIFGIGSDGVLTTPPRHVRNGTREEGGARGLTISPEGRTLLMAIGFNPSTGVDGKKVMTYRVGPDGGLTALGTVTTGDDPVSVVVTPDGRRLYVTNRKSNTISAFSVTPAGSLTELAAPVPSGGTEPLGIAVTPNGRFLYVSHRGTAEDLDQVTRFEILGNGTLKPLGSPARIGKTGGAMAVTPDGRFLYVPCTNSGEVFAFAIGGDGGLRSVYGSPFRAPDLPVSPAVTPDGKRLYVADGGLLESGSRLVSAFTIDGNGGLDKIADFAGGRSPVALTTTPDGRHLFVGNIDSDDVFGYGIAANGRLDVVPGSPFSLDGGEQPALEAVTVSPNQGPRASFTATPGRPTRFDATGSADPDGRVTRFDWDFGDGTTALDAGPTPTHAYPRTGTFRVTLTVTDNEGCSTRTVFTGTSTQCNGSAAARTTRPVIVG